MGHKTGDITTRLRDQALLAVVLAHPSGEVMMDAVREIETLRNVIAANEQTLDRLHREVAALRETNACLQEANRNARHD